MSPEEYIQQRVDDQIQWYSAKSGTNKKYYLWSKSMIIFLATLIPFISGFLSTEVEWPTYMVGTLGVLTAMLSGISSLFRFQEKWNEYRTTSEALIHEKFMFMTSSGQYENAKTPFIVFVNKIEHIISKEHSNWSEYITEKEE